MMRVAVLGGGPAGAFAAARLAAAGWDTVLYDEKLAWEKPCGGGLTYKAYRQYPFLIDNDTPKRLVRETVLSEPRGGSVRLHLRHPLLIYSRLDLNRFLLERARQAGACIRRARVRDAERTAAGAWRLDTTAGADAADFCIVATGARNALRGAGAALGSADTVTALGYYIPGEQEWIDIRFMPGLEGYMWVFPRCGHLSVGIAAKGEPAAVLRRRLETYAAEKGLEWRGTAFYAHVLPSLSPAAWARNRVAGEGWMAVGDAGGLVDPITGEGLYYAIRSADLAAEALLAAEGRLDAAAEQYTAAVRRDFAADLEYASTIATRFFTGRYMYGSITARTIQFTRRSETFRGLMADLFDGSQPYGGLKERVYAQLPRTLCEILLSTFQRSGGRGSGRLLTGAAG